MIRALRVSCALDFIKVNSNLLDSALKRFKDSSEIPIKQTAALFGKNYV